MRLAIVAACFAAFILATAPAASANDFQCVGAVPTGTFDNVVVPAGATCTLSNATVRGNIAVQPQGALYATNNDVHGNIESTKPRFVWLDDNEVGGRVWAKEAAVGADPLTIWFCNNRIGGNVQIEKIVASFGIIVGPGSGCPGVGGGNTVGGNLILLENVIGPSIGGINVTANTVRGNLQFFKNTGPGPKHVHANTIHEDLQCFENSPGMSGTGNVARKAEGQCSAVPLV